MTPERPATSDPDQLSVGFEATALLGRPTGVGAFCAGALTGLSGLPSVGVSAFAISWRRRHQLAALVPSGISIRQRAMPARPLHAAWARSSVPPVEWFIGHHDVVHGTNFVVPPARSAVRVATVHDLTVVLYPELCDPPTLLFPGLIRRAVAEGAWIHTPSRFIADQVVEEFSVAPDRVRAVHHGIPLPPPHGGDRGGPPIPLPEGCDRYVLAIGTVEPRKDYPLLVSAFGAVAATHPEVALVVVGADGWGAERFAAAVEGSPWRSRIVRAGYLDDATLAATLRHASVLAYPSRYEGFGFPPLQAMAAGVPVVATAAGAVPEVVGDGAALVDPGDGDGLAAAISRLLDGGSEVEEQVARGLRRSAEFTWEACATGLAGLYRDACSDRGQVPGRGPLAPPAGDGRSPSPGAPAAGPGPEGSGP
ncbi:MAG TPA: glycosyltransferase family 1 protein [Acidimicrobiales bacterium]